MSDETPTTIATLTALSALGGLDYDSAGVRIAEVTGLAIASLAAPRGADDALASAVSRLYRCAMPKPGNSVLATGTRVRLLGLARDQWFLLLDDAGPLTVARVAQQLQGAAYITDQSDSWVMIRVSGPDCRKALERICPLDLHPEVFPVGATGRTVMEHLGVIIVHEESDAFLLFCARSSAQSFWHMIKTSVAGIS